MPSPIELDYGTSGQTVTVTLASLANASARASTAIDNSTTLFEDILVQAEIVGATSGVSATGYVAIYATGSVDGGTTYGEAATGTDAGITLTAPPNVKLIGIVNLNTNSKTSQSTLMSVAAAFGGTLPQKIVLIFANSTGAALLALGQTVKYQGVQHQA